MCIQEWSRFHRAMSPRVIENISNDRLNRPRKRINIEGVDGLGVIIPAYRSVLQLLHAEVDRHVIGHIEVVLDEVGPPEVRDQRVRRLGRRLSTVETSGQLDINC